MKHRVCMSCVLVLLLLVISSPALADSVNIGSVSFDTFVNGAPGSPGSNIFNLFNLTGAIFPPLFPVLTAVNFDNVNLTLMESNGTSLSINLGTIGPGFVSPNSTVFSDTIGFTSAVLTGGLSPTTITLADGSVLKIGGSFSATIFPSHGNTLSPDGDFAIIKASTRVLSEPPATFLMGIGLLAIGAILRKRILRLS
jgi:hypothetical protein